MTKLLKACLVWVFSLFGASPAFADNHLASAFNDRQNFLLSVALSGRGDALNELTLELPRIDDPINLYGAYSAALLRLNVHIDEANTVIRRIAEWFEHPHPRGRDLRGEVDFAAIELARLYVALRDSPTLEEATKVLIRRFFTEYDFRSIYASENHEFVFHTARYLMANELRYDVFSAYQKNGEQLAVSDLDWLLRFIRYRAAFGWGEFDSGGYQALVFNTLLTLRDHAPAVELAVLAEEVANLLLADMMVDSLHGLYGGARGRVSEADVLRHGQSLIHDLKYLYFGISDYDPESTEKRLLNIERMSRWETLNFSLYTDFQPLAIVRKIALERQFPYTNRERKHLHNMDDTLPEYPLGGSIRKITYVTNEYVLGTVQFQDPYPPQVSVGYAKHQQYEWDFTVRNGLKTRIFTHHPGNSGMHTYWRGNDWRGFVDTFQYGNVVLARWNLPEDVIFPFIHAYLPRQEFDEVVDRDGWVFARSGDVYAALHMTAGMEWTTAGEWAYKEIISYGRQVASVFECGSAQEFGSFEAFQQSILENTVSFDPLTLALYYDSAQAGKVEIAANRVRLVNGQIYDLEYPLYDSPYMQAEWGSSFVRLLHNDSGHLLNSLNGQGPDLLVHYEFNNPVVSTTMATDSSGNDRHGSITNWDGVSQIPAALQTAKGVSGQAGDYAFDNTRASAMGGFDQRGGAVRWTAASYGKMINDLRAFTVCYWFRTPDGIAAGSGARAVSLFGEDDQHFFENRFATIAGVDGFGQTVVTGNFQRTSAAPAYIRSGKWTFVAITFDGMAPEFERIKMYVGGIITPVYLVGSFYSDLEAITLGGSNNSLTLGGYFTGSGQTPFQAIMDDFRLYGNSDYRSDGALSLTQLEAIRMENAGYSRVNLHLEQSSNLKDWEEIQITPHQLNVGGYLQVFRMEGIQFFRLRIELEHDW